MPGSEIKTVVDMLRSGPPMAGDVPTMRANMMATAGAMPKPEGVGFEEVSANGVRAEWVTAPGASLERAVVYAHGGGYVMGGIETHRGVVAGISAAAGARVLSVDYRLAPEAMFPAAVDDVCAAYRFVREQGVAADKIAIAGDSAGGGLTVASLVALRDAGDALPAAGVCISPWVDLTLSGDTVKTLADEDPMVTSALLETCTEAYVGEGDAKAPLASPLFADLTGLPPLLVHVGTAEILLDDARRLAERGKAAGVDVTLEEWESMIHVWHAFGAMLPEAGQAIDRIGEFLAEHFAAA